MARLSIEHENTSTIVLSADKRCTLSSIDRFEKHYRKHQPIKSDFRAVHAR